MLVLPEGVFFSLSESASIEADEGFFVPVLGSESERASAESEDE
jgi:hypothetical protein